MRPRAGELDALGVADRKRAERWQLALVPANRQPDVLSRLAVAVAATDPDRAEQLIASLEDRAVEIGLVIDLQTRTAARTASVLASGLTGSADS